MRFYPTFGFLEFRFVNKERWIFSKAVKISDFWSLFGWIDKYKPASSKSNSSLDNPYCLRLVIVSLAVNVGKLHPLINEDNFFCWVYNDFCSSLLLSDIIDFLRMQKPVVESRLHKKVSEYTKIFLNMLKFFIALFGGAMKKFFTNWSSIFIWNIRQFKDKEFRIHTKLFATVEKINV